MTSAKTRPPGRWKAGESGNPSGRPPGTGTVAKLRSQIAEHVPEMIAKLVEQAKAGDVSASRLLLERVIPPMRPAEETVKLSLPDGSLTEQGKAVITALGAGVVAPGQAAQLLSGLGSLAKIWETDELAARIEALEQANANQPQ